MPTRQTGHPSAAATLGWTTPPPWAALVCEWVRTATPGHRALATVRHAGHPWTTTWPDWEPSQEQLAAMANRYLQQLQAVLDKAPSDADIPGPASQGKTRLMPDAVSKALAQPWPSKIGDIRWLPVGENQAGTTLTRSGSPHCSHWVRLDKDKPGEGSLVLLAGRVADSQVAGSRALGGDVGLRLVVHVRQGVGHILGVVASGLWEPNAELPDKDHQGQNTTPEDLLQAVENNIQDYLATTDRVCIDSLTGADTSKGDGISLRAWGHTYQQPRDPQALAQAQAASQVRGRKLKFYAELNNVYKVVRLSKQSVIGTACATVRRDAVAVVPPFLVGQVDAQQPRRRARPPRMDGPRQILPMSTHTLLAIDGPNQRRWLEVHGLNPQRKKEAQGNAQKPMQDRAIALDITPPVPPASAQRSTAGVRPRRLPGDQDAALHAYLRGQHLFDRLHAYGFSPEAYFRFARLPLVLRPRAGFSNMPEGDSPAAEVRPFFAGQFAPGDQQTKLPRPQLLVKFGSADAHDREWAEGSLHAPKRHRAQYLGVAADPRWAWHEFGHVLSYAATGELEFEFAHSVGDALAAIASDPLSDLANDPERRGETFPWIQVPGRRHDRQAQLGHCWCGRRNLLRLRPGSGPQRLFQHGYFEEQLLSSALFRLYRCVGGDTAGSDDISRLTRLAASDHVVYLIIRALALLGPDNVATARTPNQWVSALVDADFGQALWSVEAGWAAPEGQPRSLKRTGGQLAKVIRWAFEQQGLYATDDPEAVAEGVGRPPRVDLYLPDQRQGDPNGAEGDGGYWPVPLREGWSGRAEAEPQPAWWGSPSAVTRAGGTLQVQIGNRGWASARQVQVEAWVADRSFHWSRVAHAEARGSVAAGAVHTVAFDGVAAHDKGRWLLLRVQNEDDPSCVPGSAPEWPTDEAALMHLVSRDNNLGLCPWPA